MWVIQLLRRDGGAPEYVADQYGTTVDLDEARTCLTIQSVIGLVRRWQKFIKSNENSHGKTFFKVLAREAEIRLK